MIHGSSRWYGTPSTVTRALPSISPAVTGKPIRVTTCGSSPLERCASAISWVRTVYPALTDGSASVTICRTLLARGGDPPETPRALLARGGDPPETPRALLARGGDP